MNRRAALNRLSLFAGGTLLLTFCRSEAEKDVLTENAIRLSGESKKMVTKIIDQIIPTTDTPGAIDLHVDLFVLKMVNDCYSNDDKRNFLAGLSAMKTFTHTKYGNHFSRLSKSETEQLLNDVDKINESAEVQKNHLKFTFTILKKHTIQGYLQSEYVMTNLLPHNMIPGKFKGCVEITDPNNIKAVIA